MLLNEYEIEFMFRTIQNIRKSAEKNRVGRDPEPHIFFFTPYIEWYGHGFVE
jgi:hypothetical protein